MEMRFRNRMSQLLYGTSSDDGSSQKEQYEAEAAQAAAEVAA